jgi:hypothetical protein
VVEDSIFGDDSKRLKAFSNSLDDNPALPKTAITTINIKKFIRNLNAMERFFISVLLLFNDNK